MEDSFIRDYIEDLLKKYSDSSIGETHKAVHENQHSLYLQKSQHTRVRCRSPLGLHDTGR